MDNEKLAQKVVESPEFADYLETSGQITMGFDWVSFLRYVVLPIVLKALQEYVPAPTPVTKTLIP